MLLAQMKLLSIDLSMLIALIALLYTIREIRRSNNIIVKIKECTSGYHQSIDENNTQGFWIFKVTIQNKGINLYCPKMKLSFRHEKGGTFYLPLKQGKQENFSVDTFSKGMTTTFHFKTYELDRVELDLLNLLSDTRKQNASLCLCSQNYRAKVYLINSVADRLKREWNKLSYKFLFSRKKGKNWEGNDIVKHYQLPTFQTLTDKIELFIQSCNEQFMEKGKTRNSHL